MQTFLPHPDFTHSARSLDRQRLGKQRLEAAEIWQILATNKTSSSWWHHPAVRMWEGHLEALAAYFDAIVIEWERRGYQNNYRLTEVRRWQPPPWLGDPDFHASHRAVLLGKEQMNGEAPWYQHLGWIEKPAIPLTEKRPYKWPYKWPVALRGAA